MRLDDIKSTNPIAVGDFVMFEDEAQQNTNEDGTITELLPRRNYVVRKSTNLSKQTHVLAANVDQALLVVTINYPITTLVFIDRFLASAEAYGVPVIIVFNKVDRYSAENLYELDQYKDLYTSLGYQVIDVCAKKEIGLDKVKAILKDKVSVIAGHSGVGKSTLMNALSKSNVFAENKLFATLDTTVRKVVIENLPFLVADTVGFIRKLPTGLVESFKSTLDEVREADLLLHVVDISHPAFEQQIEVVDKTIHELCGSEKPTIIVFNKVDAFTYKPKDADDLTEKTRENYSLEELKQTWMAKKDKHCIFISAKEKFNFDELRQVVYTEVKKIHTQRFPYNDFLYDDEWTAEN